MLMENKGTDVTLFVFFFFFESFLELTVLLEAAFLCHGFLFVVGLHHTAFRTELAKFALKHLVSAELTLQRAVEDGNLDTRLQSDGIKAFLTVTEHPSLVALEFMLQLLANHLVGGQQVRCGNTLTIRRIGNDDGWPGRFFEVLKVLLFNGDGFGQSSCFYIEAGGINCLHVDVIAIDMMVELLFLGIVVIDFIEKVFVEVGPFLKGKFLAENTR